MVVSFPFGRTLSGDSVRFFLFVRCCFCPPITCQCRIILSGLWFALLQSGFARGKAEGKRKETDEQAFWTLADCPQDGLGSRQAKPGGVPYMRATHRLPYTAIIRTRFMGTGSPGTGRERPWTGAGSDQYTGIPYAVQSLAW